jgi:hypothetical protein
MVSGGTAAPFLTSTLNEGEWSASSLGRFTAGKRAHVTRWIGGLVGLGASLDTVEKRKLSCPCPERAPGTHCIAGWLGSGVSCLPLSEIELWSSSP